MKKIVLFFIILITTIIFCGCTYQNSVKNSSSAVTVVQETAAIFAETTAPITTVNPNAQTTFILTSTDYEKLKAPLIVWALANEFNNESNYDLKNGLTKENIANYVWYIAYGFDYFYPSTPRYAEYFNTSNEKYGIKKGDMKLSDNKLHIPQKAINSILRSTFGEEVLKGIDLNKNLFDGVENYGPSKKLKDGIYIIGLGDDYPEGDFLGTLDLPVKGNENTEFKTSFKAIYGYETEGVEPETVNFSILFKLRKDDTSEWGYNITAFNMQEVK